MKRLIPSIGIVFFILLYIYATTLYPGASAVHPDAAGFDWVHNYWCDLLTTQSINGSNNAARPYGIAAMIFCVVLWRSSFSNLQKLFPFLKDGSGL